MAEALKVNSALFKIIAHATSSMGSIALVSEQEETKNVPLSITKTKGRLYTHSTRSFLTRLKLIGHYYYSSRCTVPL